VPVPEPPVPVPVLEPPVPVPVLEPPVPVPVLEPPVPVPVLEPPVPVPLLDPPVPVPVLDPPVPLGWPAIVPVQAARPPPSSPSSLSAATGFSRLARVIMVHPSANGSAHRR
jgi:hypothetical protein